MQPLVEQHEALVLHADGQAVAALAPGREPAALRLVPPVLALGSGAVGDLLELPVGGQDERVLLAAHPGAAVEPHADAHRRHGLLADLEAVVGAHGSAAVGEAEGLVHDHAPGDVTVAAARQLDGGISPAALELELIRELLPLLVDLRVVVVPHAVHEQPRLIGTQVLAGGLQHQVADLPAAHWSHGDAHEVVVRHDHRLAADRLLLHGTGGEERRRQGQQDHAHSEHSHQEASLSAPAAAGPP